MALVTADDIACLRGELADTLTDLCSISRPTDAADAFGGQMRTWATVATNVACRIAPETRRPVEEAREGRFATIGDYVVTLPAGQDITERDRVVIGGLTYEVIGVRYRTNELTRRAACVKVT